MSPATFIRLEECPTASFPIHHLEVWQIGERWFGLCQHCGRHKAIHPDAPPFTWEAHFAALAEIVNPIGGDY